MIPRRYVSPVLLASVVVIATSGLVYELIAGTVASYVLGDSVAQFSFVIGLYLFAMGVGSYLSKFIEKRLLERFVEIELSIAIAGGLSAPILMILYTSYGAFRVGLYVLVMLIGTLVGLEIPILIRLLKFRLELKDLVARVLSLDYVGALIASLLFPLLLLPRLGIQKTSLAFGILNASVAGLSTFVMPIEHKTVWRLRGQCVLVVLALAAGMFVIDQQVLKGEARFFGAPIIYAEQSPYQRIVITQSPKTTRLFLNGNLQFSSDDEHRYHETLVHPAVAALGRDPRSVLVLGGGDGLAVRELLKYPGVETVTLVDLDSAVTKLFSTVPVATEINANALLDPRVHVINEDAFLFLGRTTDSFDLAVVDFPDPSNYALGKLYSLSFYLRLRQRIGVRGVGVIQSTSPYYARTAFWSIVATVEEAGFSTLPMHAYVPSFGEWGFVIVGGKELKRPRHPRLGAASLKYLDDAVLHSLFEFPADMQRVDAPVNRINDQQLVSIYTGEWESWR